MPGEMPSVMNLISVAFPDQRASILGGSQVKVPGRPWWSVPAASGANMASLAAAEVSLGTPSGRLQSVTIPKGFESAGELFGRIPLHPPNIPRTGD